MTCKQESLSRDSASCAVAGRQPWTVPLFLGLLGNKAPALCRAHRALRAPSSPRGCLFFLLPPSFLKAELPWPQVTSKLPNPTSLCPAYFSVCLTQPGTGPALSTLLWATQGPQALFPLAAAPPAPCRRAVGVLGSDLAFLDLCPCPGDLIWDLSLLSGRTPSHLPFLVSY